MASESTAPGPSSVTFDVILESDTAKPRRTKFPTRLQQKEQTGESLDEAGRALKIMIKEKQDKAQQNKKEMEAARLLRIHQRREQCRHMASKMERLLAQDAKRHGVAGTETIRPMSRKEAGAMIHSVHRDFQQLGAELNDNLET